MRKFLVKVKGEVLVEAASAGEAKKIIKGRCIEHAPWLILRHGEARCLASPAELKNSEHVFVG